ncbi:MAG: hypothetical protein WC761_04480 [Candidatus Paceibacterota bacterium]|jgi:adenylate kinase family enzyme
MRISIIGHSSSGKSTLARKVSDKFGIPHLHIDRLWFESGAYKLLKPKDVEKLNEARVWIKNEVSKWILQKDWVSDGWYPKVQSLVTKEADQLVFIDIPLWKRLKNHVKRIFTTERHRELSKWDDIKFIFNMIIKTIKRDKKMRQFAKENESKLVVLKTYAEVEQYLKNLK